MVTVLITPEGLEAAGVHCAALSWTFRGSLRNGCEESREKTINKQEEGRWRGIGHMEGGDEDRKLEHVGRGRAVHAGLEIESTLWAVSLVAD